MSDKLIIPSHSDIHFNGKEVEVRGIDINQVSDGYHTFGELYDHRCLLVLAFGSNIPKCLVWKSLKHDDGSSFEGWFIVGVDLRTDYTQYPIMITYHIPIKYWDICNFPIVDKAPKWDGHTSKDVIDRLIAYITAFNR